LIFVDMLRKGLLIILGVILFSICVNAVEIRVLDGSSGDEINDVIARISYEDGMNRVVLVDKNIITFDSVDKEVEITLDDADTNSVDYYFNGLIDTNGLVFTPVAQIRGSVYDALDNLLSNVDLEFDCNSLSNIDFPIKTDRFGGFSTYVPVGECNVFSTKGNYMGRSVFISERGEVIELKIVLDDKVDKGGEYIWIFVVLLLIYLAYKFIPKKKKVVRKKEHRKLKAVLKTSNENEKKVLEYLISNGNKSTSSKIRHDLKIAKTTLSRILDRLEKKKILELEREGKLKKVKIADWLIK